MELPTTKKEQIMNNPTHILHAEVHHGDFNAHEVVGMDFAGATDWEMVDQIQEAIDHIRDETRIGYYAPTRDRARQLAGRIYAEEGYELEHGWVRYWVEEA